uniref:Casein kinase substrate phosphoprotein PP28 domain-containing protein n=1 Tax=Theileria parva TaxID=5875 RepID=Q4N7X1_THEPA|eukprot:XP_766220.1 hypothetical protein [Theileria parva strain Muguga]
MGYKSRGSHKKFTPRGRSRYVASDDEIIARNQEISQEKHKESESDESSDDSNELEEVPTRLMAEGKLATARADLER